MVESRNDRAENAWGLGWVLRSLSLNKLTCTEYQFRFFEPPREKEIGRKTEEDMPTLVLPDRYCFLRIKKDVGNNSIALLYVPL